MVEEKENKTVKLNNKQRKELKEELTKFNANTMFRLETKEEEEQRLKDIDISYRLHLYYKIKGIVSDMVTSAVITCLSVLLLILISIFDETILDFIIDSNPYYSLALFVILVLVTYNLFKNFIKYNKSSKLFIETLTTLRDYEW